MLSQDRGARYGRRRETGEAKPRERGRGPVMAISHPPVCRGQERAVDAQRAENVSQASGSPVVNPFRNHSTRWAEEPWVKDSGATYPRV
jgi:hypothetical protein